MHPRGMPMLRVRAEEVWLSNLDCGLLVWKSRIYLQREVLMLRSKFGVQFVGDDGVEC